MSATTRRRHRSSNRYTQRNTRSMESGEASKESSIFDGLLGNSVDEGTPSTASSTVGSLAQLFSSTPTPDEPSAPATPDEPSAPVTDTSMSGLLDDSDDDEFEDDDTGMEEDEVDMEEGKDDMVDDMEADEDEDGDMGADEGEDLDKLSMVPNPSSTPSHSNSPSTGTIKHLIQAYEIPSDNICLKKDLQSCQKEGDVIHSNCLIKNGMFTKDIPENKVVAVVLYVFPNIVTTGLVVGTDAEKVSGSKVVTAGQNVNIRSCDHVWAPFPGVSDVYVKMNCCVIETTIPVNMGDTVMSKTQFGINIHSGKLGELQESHSLKDFTDSDMPEESIHISTGGDETLE